MDAAKSVTANYVKQWKLSLATGPVAGIGTANPSASPSSTDGYYDATTVVTVSATTPVTIDAGSRWRFDNWSGDGTGTTAASRSVTMDAAKSVTANYVKQFKLT